MSFIFWDTVKQGSWQTKLGKELKEKERIYVHIHWKWTLRIMHLITPLSSSQFYPESLSSPEMSHNHDTLFCANLISDGANAPRVIYAAHCVH